MCMQVKLAEEFWVIGRKNLPLFIKLQLMPQWKNAVGNFSSLPRGHFLSFHIVIKTAGDNISESSTRSSSQRPIMTQALERDLFSFSTNLPGPDLLSLPDQRWNTWCGRTNEAFLSLAHGFLLLRSQNFIHKNRQSNSLQSHEITWSNF